MAFFFSTPAEAVAVPARPDLILSRAAAARQSELRRERDRLARLAARRLRPDALAASAGGTRPSSAVRRIRAVFRVMAEPIESEDARTLACGRDVVERPAVTSMPA